MSEEVDEFAGELAESAPVTSPDESPDELAPRRTRKRRSDAGTTRSGTGAPRGRRASSTRVANNLLQFWGIMAALGCGQAGRVSCSRARHSGELDEEGDVTSFVAEDDSIERLAPDVPVDAVEDNDPPAPAEPSIGIREEPVFDLEWYLRGEDLRRAVRELEGDRGDHG